MPTRRGVLGALVALDAPAHACCGDEGCPFMHGVLQDSEDGRVQLDHGHPKRLRVCCMCSTCAVHAGAQTWKLRATAVIVTKRLLSPSPS